MSAIVAGVLVVAGCIVGFGAAPRAVSTDLSVPATEAMAKYYVSIGDSYAAGYRPIPAGVGSTSTDGFAYQLEESLQARQPDWRLVNFGCSGETTSSMTFDRGCDAGAGGPDGRQYPDDPQSVAAAKFIADHGSQVGLVTIVMGATTSRRVRGLPNQTKPGRAPKNRCRRCGRTSTRCSRAFAARWGPTFRSSA